MRTALNGRTKFRLRTERSNAHHLTLHTPIKHFACVLLAYVRVYSPTAKAISSRYKCHTDSCHVLGDVLLFCLKCLIRVNILLRRKIWISNLGSLVVVLASDWPAAADPLAISLSYSLPQILAHQTTSKLSLWSKNCVLDQWCENCGPPLFSNDLNCWYPIRTSKRFRKLRNDIWTWGVPSRSVCEIKGGWSYVKHNSGKIKHIMW